MKSPLFAMAAAMTALGCATAQESGGLGGVLSTIGEAMEQAGLGEAAYSAADADAALRQALEIGARAVSDQLGRADGYFADPEVKIPLPARLATAQAGLKRVGLSGPLDELEVKMNRAAEAAAPEAAGLFIDAVRAMTVEDAIAIVRGGDDAATQYLRAATEPALAERFEPIVAGHLQDVGAITALDAAADRARLGGAADQLKADFASHVVGAALDGVFFYLAKEEADIRQDPARHATAALRRVFGQ
ncbi:MAG: DUF4197 domain-containing protein [Caulobacterales bacterium]|nr:DUF4197 domain-containing protein [Caulobacterales bacterium]